MTVPFDMRRLHHGCGESLWGWPLGTALLPAAERAQGANRYRRLAPKQAGSGAATDLVSQQRSAE